MSRLLTLRLEGGGMKVFLVALITFGLSLSAAIPQSGPPEIKSGYIRTSDGVRIHYLEAGKGPAIVFIPGWLCPTWIWEPQIRYFAAHYRAVAMDRRSQGDSEQVTEGLYPERMAQDIKELGEQLGLAPMIAVGHSMAVDELLAYVNRFGTADLAGLVLVDNGFGSAEASLPLAFFQLLISNRNLVLGNMGRSFFKKPPSQEFFERLNQSVNKIPTTTAVTLRISAGGHDYRPMLGKIDKPLLFAITPGLKSAGELLKTRVPRARVEVFEDSGHVLFMDEADKFNTILEEFARSAFEKKSVSSRH